MICPALTEALMPDHPALDSFGTLAPAAADRPPGGPNARADLLTAVRCRMKKGYYNSPGVIDEISDSFARVFNEKS